MIKKMKLKKLKCGLLILISILVFSACESDTYENGANDAIETEEANYVETEDSQTAYIETEDLEDSEELQVANIEMENPQADYIILPLPELEGDMSVEAALANRRSRRNFQDKALSTEQLSQILWAAYGITAPMPDAPRGGFRTSPSAGATFPLEIYVIVGDVDGIEAGVYRYISEEHKIVRIIDGDVRSELSEAALGQVMVKDAPASVFYSAVFERATGIYGERGIMYTHMEAGHSAQNIYLQAEALGLGTVAIGAFTDDRVRQLLNLPDDEEPLYLLPFGYFYD